MLDPMLNLKRKNLIKPRELHKFDLEFTTADSFIQVIFQYSFINLKIVKYFCRHLRKIQ
jgi:hypothetical protein